MWTWWFAAGSILSAVGIGAGAFGAHALKGKLSPEDLVIFDTASRYLSMQSIGLLAIALLMSRIDSTSLKISAFAMIFGILIFSGSLFALIGTGQRWLGAITPIGGSLMIVAWLMAAWAAISANWA
jgi:uncharacterized membrane protein YgdD (TMEM256/DUF423 family)